MNRTWIAVAAVCGFLGVALGAFGAHMLEERLSEDMMSAYETGVLYHLVHAAALLGFAAVTDRLAPSRWLAWAPRLLLAGIVLFSGSLYVMSISGFEPLGIVTPFGGVSLLAGWTSLAAAAWTTRPGS